MAGCFEDLEWRGLVHQASDPCVAELVDGGELTVYAGFDPSSASLHHGNLLQLCLLRRLQLAGNRVIALVGGATGLIGDPGGKAGERDLLDRSAVAANVAGVRAQLERFFGAGDGAARPAGVGEVLVVDNAEWLENMDVLTFLRDVGKHFTVNQMMAKESVRARIERPEQGISYAEFSYMLLQAYDFLHLHGAYGCRLQCGASDQWGNITQGIELVRRVRGAEVFGLTTPLVVRSDGTKFGKTEAGAIWLDPGRTSPYGMYQYFLHVEDAMAGTLLRYLTFLSAEEILSLEAETLAHPERRAAQERLAKSVTGLVHGEDALSVAQESSEALFGRGIASLDTRSLLDLVAGAPSSTIPAAKLDHVPLVDIAAEVGLCGSKSEARRLIRQGGLYLNEVRVESIDAALGTGDLLHGEYAVLRAGKSRKHVVRIAPS